MSKDTSWPAFPNAETEKKYPAPGMTIRQWYAGLAMQGLYQVPAFRMANLDDYAKKAFEMADAMLLEGSK